MEEKQKPKIKYSIGYYKSHTTEGSYDFLTIFKKRIINGYVEKVDYAVISKSADRPKPEVLKVEKQTIFDYGIHRAHLYPFPTNTIYELKDKGVSHLKHNRYVNDYYISKYMACKANSKKINKKQFLEEVTLGFNNGINAVNDIYDSSI